MAYYVLLLTSGTYISDYTTLSIQVIKRMNESFLKTVERLLRQLFSDLNTSKLLQEVWKQNKYD